MFSRLFKGKPGYVAHSPMSLSTVSVGNDSANTDSNNTKANYIFFKNFFPSSSVFKVIEKIKLGAWEENKL